MQNCAKCAKCVAATQIQDQAINVSGESAGSIAFLMRKTTCVEAEIVFPRSRLAHSGDYIGFNVESEYVGCYPLAR